MTYEDLIVAIDNEAPRLSGVSYKLLWRLVSLSIQQGSSEVTISCAELGRQLGVTRDAITAAHRQLSTLIPIDVTKGSTATFTLPADWFGLQRPLFVTETVRPKLRNLTTNQAGTCLEIRQEPDDKPGSTCRLTRQDLTTNQAGLAWKYGSTWGKTRQDLTTNQAGSPPDPIRNAPARVDRSIDQNFADSELIRVIDRALHTVKILPSQRQAAEILSDTLIEYRSMLAEASGFNATPDETVLARILAIAPIDELCGWLRRLLTDKVRPGKQDMWFFTVLFQKIHGASAQLTRSRYDEMKRRKPPMNETLPNFGPELVSRTASGMPRF